MARFATAAELTTFLGGTVVNTPRAEQVLDLASALIRRTCNGAVLEAFTGRQEEFAGDDRVHMLPLAQRPVTAVTSVTIDAVAFSEFEWTRWGTVVRNDEAAWSTGPILVTYDGGYGPTDDEFLSVKSICLEAAARCVTKETPDAGTFGEQIVEAAGWAPHLFLTLEERARLQDFGAVPVG